ncbi:beta-galactosidase [Chitinophaga terrae (ex Kim and Jung 2007)]|uniref:Beta-galactosidase n=1 Tax=Chitinophaga terrae (ex Kim and Jung 2007) TaxID=408074 RepID=A0A1H3YZK8_9BACT|nr:beta-galactosidase family protein [Chitinophaga terrae (ex Kim and Jung 2007)]GEP88592.1 beta-galactosidase [Chitinophaga terrae (ex Kim and Jung 2007)]SEA16929.1 beta-galactosidase [Chitinophaga terrae (ex Kim and Jung 2007)]
MKKILLTSGLALCCWFATPLQAQNRHSFSLSPTAFLLDNKPFQMISGEMHPARIPKEYWRHRIQMAKAMGCNTIAAYVFWNYHEPVKGQFDFSSENRDIAEFIRLAQQEGMWVLLRPGPYVCAEWEFGGLPPYLLQIPDIKVRCMDHRYMEAVKRYVTALAKEVKPLLVTNGGPIVMVQIENEYGSYGNDKTYLNTLKDLWVENGINVPFYTADGATAYMLEAGGVPGAAIGLDSGSSEADFEAARKQNPNVPSFSSETYPGWLTHWGENWQRPGIDGIVKEVKFLMDTKRSFNLYVIHGGTNFGFTAGANSGGKGYEPDVTSYDYDAPINEQGAATPKYMALRQLLASYLPKGKKLPPVPAAIPTISIPAFTPTVFTSVWDHLPAAVSVPQPKPFEAVGQDYGFMLYKTKLIGHKSGKLTIKDLHDYATVFLNGQYIGKLDRRLGEKTIEIPTSNVKDPELEILVEGMGRINFAEAMIDRKGITDRVVLNGMTLMNWEMYSLPMNEASVQSLTASATHSDKPGQYFKASFNLDKTGDTYIDMSAYQKGIVWVNGHNLGRYWQIGPQQRLYCPATWLRKGSNEILIFDLHQTTPASVTGEPHL